MKAEDEWSYLILDFIISAFENMKKDKVMLRGLMISANLKLIIKINHYCCLFLMGFVDDIYICI